MPFSCGLHRVNGTCHQTPANGTSMFTGPLPIGRLGGPVVEVVFELYLTCIVCIIGLVGNISLLVVLRKERERRKSLLLLQVLAIADSLYLITALMRFPLKYIIPDKDAYTAMQPYVLPLLKTFQSICIWTMVLVTIDRFIYVCYPMRAFRLFSLRRKIVFTVIIFVMGFVYNIPRFLAQCILKVEYVCTNVTITRMVYTPTFQNPLYFSVYLYAMYFILLYIVPIGMIGGMNIKLIKTIHASQRRHSCNGLNVPNTENNATFVLIIIIVVFIICETPELVLLILTIVHRYAKSVSIMATDAGISLQIFTSVSEFFMVLNSSVNFFIYMLLSRRFRRAIKRPFEEKSPFTTNVETLPLK